MNHSIRLPRRPLLGSIAALLLASAAPVFAQSPPSNATWLPNPGTGDWNTSSNWTGNTVPTGTATFVSSSITTVTVSSSSPTQVGGIQFVGSPFTIGFNPAAMAPVLIFNGPGITNSSGAVQNFLSGTDSTGNSTGFVFAGSATAGSNTVFTNNGGTLTNASGGFTQFQNTSSAGSATLIANAGTGGALGGEIYFFDQSDGGTARVILNGSGISAGALDISNISNPTKGNVVNVGSIEGSGIVFLGKNNLTVGGNNMPTTFSGVIQDGGDNGGVGGSLTKVGTSALTLTGMNTYTGNTIVNGGVLNVNGQILSPTTTVNAGAALAGGGIIGGNVVNNGNVAPGGGGSLTLTVKGNYTQGSSGALVIGVFSPNSSSLLKIGGSATLGGTLQIFNIGNVQFTAPGQEITVLTAKSVTGTFSNVSGLTSLNGPPNLIAQVIYLPGAVEIQATQAQSLAGEIKGIPGVTLSDLGVAQLIDLNSSNPAVANLLNFLHTLTPGQLASDIELINPTVISTVLSNVNSSLATQTINSLTSRFSALQSTGVLPAAGPAGPDGKGGKEVMPPAANRWGAFITGSGEFEHVDDTSVSRGFNSAAGGFTLGVDYRFTDHLVVGILGSYTNTGIDIPTGKVNVNAGKGGLYGTWFDGGFYVNSALEGGGSSYDNHREGLGGAVRSSTSGGDFSALFAPGYNWTMGGLTFGPTTRFQYTYTSTDGFTESGSLAPMTIGSQHTESIVSGLGMKASYDFKIGSTIIRPELRLEWEHEYGDTNTTIDAGLAAIPGGGRTVALTGPTIGRDDLHLGVGLAVVFNERYTAYAYYDGQFFRTNYDASTVTGGLRVSF